jgi:N-methylhydantoinase A
MRRLRVAVDTGGTFTDFVVLTSRPGRYRSRILSSPDDLDRGYGSVGRFRRGSGPHHHLLRHGTTVGTNALLEQKGPHRSAVTSGFRGIYEIMEQASRTVRRCSTSSTTSRHYWRRRAVPAR